jgi:hypothetical protein
METKKIPLVIETGRRRVFASALDWPGWCRSGRDEESAIRALFEYRMRYARALEAVHPGFQPPAEESDFTILERLTGDSTTDFGSPGKPPSADAAPMDPEELEHSAAILKACWHAFDRIVKAAGGRALRKGPRGGGRSLEEILRHMLDGEYAYLGRIGWPFKPESKADPAAELRRTRAAMLEGVAAAAAGKLPANGPRGGIRWTARYFVRRTAWHELDHAWEIEDRSVPL